MNWKEPRAVDEFWWLDIETYKGGRLDRVGRVTWLRSGEGLYSPSITVESANGLGLYCWPDFRALAEAQEFVEKLMRMPLAELKAFHGTQWPNVVL